MDTANTKSMTDFKNFSLRKNALNPITIHDNKAQLLHVGGTYILTSKKYYSSLQKR